MPNYPQKPLRVLSLFDGISTGRYILEKLNIKVEAYYASEINVYAEQVSQRHYPDIIRLGDIRELNETNLPKDIDLLLAGFPCQSFSIAGLKLGLDSEQGSLAYDLLRVRDLVKPKYFFFENVAGVRTSRSQLDELFGSESVLVNSGYFSAQVRNRLYWTNVPEPKMPFPTFLNPLEFRHIRDYSDTRSLIGAKGQTGDNVKPGCDKYFTPFIPKGIHKITNRGLKRVGALTNKYLDSESKAKRRDRVENRVYSENGKYPTVTSAGLGAAVFLDGGKYIRRPSNLELERLQGLPDNYTKVFGLHDYHRRVALGNAWQANTVGYLLTGLAPHYPKWLAKVWKEDSTLYYDQNHHASFS